MCWNSIQWHFHSCFFLLWVIFKKLVFILRTFRNFPLNPMLKFHSNGLWCGSLFIYWAEHSRSFCNLNIHILQFWEILFKQSFDNFLPLPLWILTRCSHFPVPPPVPVCSISLWLQGLVLDPFLCLHLPQQWSSPDLTNNFLRFPLGTYFPQSFYIPRCPVVHGSLGTGLGTWLCLCDTLLYSRMVLGTYKDVLGAQMWVKESKEFQLPSEQLKEIQININSCVLLK